MTRESVEGALAASGGNRRMAARSLGVSHVTFYKWMRRFRIATPYGGGKEFPAVETPSTVPTVKESRKSFESNGQGTVKSPSLRAVATQAASPAGDSKGRNARTVYMTDEHWNILSDATIDLAFYTRQKQSVADVVATLIERYLPKLLAEVQEEEPGK